MDEKKSKKQQYEIPVHGSLGLLAMGDRGLRAWREVRDSAKKKTPKKS